MCLQGIGAFSVPETALYDITGKRLHNLDIQQAGPSMIRLNTGALNPGLYILRVKAGNSVTSTKIMVE